MFDPIAPAFVAATRARRQRRGSGAAFALLATALVVGVVLAAALVPVGRGGARLVETPVPGDAWAMDLGRDRVPPAEEQAQQVAALRAAATGTAGLLALLALLTLMGLWRQRLRLRRPEDYVHWAVGARRRQLVARLAGERWPWMLVTGIAASIALLAGPPLLAGTFPGEARIPPPVGSLLILGTALAVLLLRGEARAGEHAARPRRDPFRRLASSSGSVAAVGFAILTGVTLLDRYGPDAGLPPVPVGTVVAQLSVGEGADGRASEADRAWLIGGAGVGVAGAGTVRGTGQRARLWVDCGRCSEGGLPLPVRTVAAEVFAVAPDTFAHLGLSLRAGRDFLDSDGRDAPPAAIVSRALAARHFERGDAVGRRVRFGDGDWITVVGIVDDRPDLRDHTEYAVYLPLAAAGPRWVELVGPSEAAVRAALVDAPEIAAAAVPRAVAEVFAVHRWFGGIMDGLGIVCLGLVVFGVWLGARNEAQATVFQVSLRKAVGARPRHLVREFTATASKRLLVSFGAGAWLSLFLSSGLNKAYGSVPAMDLSAWAVAAVPVAVALVLGSLPPFVRALRTHPVEGLARAE
ncbi:MAG TPA: ABC transporter permease [Longimicrobiales bacterium]|nr:ABC transporter permease [Longimicrobiales bacterium]